MKHQLNWILTASTASLLVATMPAQAYELATHARMTYSAYLQSRLDKHHPTRAALALPQGSYTLLGKYYCDLSNEGVCRSRSAFEYDWNNDKFPKFTDPSMDRTRLVEFPVGWMMSGAVREDDVSRTLNVLNVLGDPNPQDDPDSGITALNRPCNHFLDPLNNKPLQSTFSTQLCLGDILADAGIWALGKRYGFSTPLTTSEDRSRRNHFTIYDAREAMWRALTLTEWRDGSPRAIYSDSAAAWSERARNRYWATVFRALGDVVHLVQDMGQPQHTRNEMHFAAPHSIYETYINARAIGKAQATIKLDDEITAERAFLPWLPYEGYPTPQFRYLSDFFSTGSAEQSQRGQGLANYSNRGFFTQAANINNTYYAQPSANAAVYRPTHDRTPQGAMREYLDGDVTDTLIDQTDSIHMVRKGLLHDTFMSLFGSVAGAGSTVYTLDRLVFDEQARLLIPRAVAYSAGVMDHLFRGAMEISMSELNAYAIVDHGLFAPGQIYGATNPETGWKGFDKIRLRVKNTTPDIRLSNGTSVSQPMNNGRLVAVIKFRRNLCYTDDLRGELTALANLSACRSTPEEIVTSEFAITPLGAEVRQVPFATEDNPDGIELIFPFPNRQIPINAWGVILQVVYRGSLGDEDDAVVVASKDISEPTFIQFFDMSDCSLLDPPGTACNANGISGARYRADLFLQPRFALRPNRFGVALSLGWPSAPPVSDLNFPGRIVRIAGLFDLGTQIEMRRYLLKNDYPLFEDPTSHAVFVHRSAVQTGYDALAAEVAEPNEERFREVPVNQMASVMWWAPSADDPNGPGMTESNSSHLTNYFASRLARIRYPTPVTILNW